MTSLRLMMEKHIDKHYSCNHYIYYGNRTDIFRSKETNPLYELIIKNNEKSQSIFLMGCQPNYMVILCKLSLSKVKKFEFDNKMPLVFSYSCEGNNILGRSVYNNDVQFTIDYIITGNQNVLYKDNNNLNNVLSNLTDEND